jgi:hypothetical protein
MKNRIAYLVISNNNEKSLIYTNSRKTKSLMKINNDLKIFMFKSISKGCWDQESVYKLNYDGTEDKVEMFEDNSCIYSDLGCLIMKNIAKAEWNSSIKYPDNGWHVCSICGKITNEIGNCLYCEDFVCWNCSCEAVTNSEWERDFCSYECYRNYLEEEYDIPYDEDEDEDDIESPDIEEFLQQYDLDELIKLAKYLNVFYENDEEEELLDSILEKDEYSIQLACEELFGDDFDEFVDDYKINNSWRYSNYESKNIDDWDEDDHLASWYDHMMEK